MIDPFEGKPVYEEDQVITQDNLRSMLEELQADVYEPLDEMSRHRLEGSIVTIELLLEWLELGKPAGSALDDHDD